jgi:hypothetical protein
MDSFVGKKFSPNVLLHDVPMFKNLLAGGQPCGPPSKNGVTAGIQRSILAVASPR